MKPIHFITSFLLCLSSTNIKAVNDSHYEQVETLFKLTQMEKRINESVNSIVQLQLQQNPDIAEKKQALTSFVDKHAGWNALKDDMADMYMRTFSTEELKTINAFYITPAGQKVINTVPQLVQQRNQLAMQRLQKNIDELKTIMGDKR